MNRRGVLYDVGRVLGMNWRPVFDRQTVRRELQIIRDDLHCTAVKICGRDLDRLVAASEDALRLGLEVWFSPELWNRRPEPTLAYIAGAAGRAERLRRRWPDRVVFSVATEATMFVRGIIPGRTFSRRVANAASAVRAGRHAGALDEFLARAARYARAAFDGPLTYASLPFEPVDWALFDIVAVDLYRDSRSAPSYPDKLQSLLAHGKPVVVTEFGMRTYQGADSDGKIGTGITNWATVALHRLPIVGRFVWPRLAAGTYTRDEALQARRIAEDLAIVDAAGVDGAFVCTFVEPLSTYSPDPRHDLDMGALSLVKTFSHGHGTTYPDMTWEPKQSFYAVARFYANQSART
jgi:hypothetical protein